MSFLCGMYDFSLKKKNSLVSSFFFFTCDDESRM